MHLVTDLTNALQKHVTLWFSLGWFCPQGNSGNVWRHFWLLHLRVGAEVRDAVTHPTSDPAHNVSSRKGERPLLGPVICPTLGGENVVSPHPHILVMIKFIHYF